MITLKMSIENADKVAQALFFAYVESGAHLYKDKTTWLNSADVSHIYPSDEYLVDGFREWIRDGFPDLDKLALPKYSMELCEEIKLQTKVRQAVTGANKHLR